MRHGATPANPPRDKLLSSTSLPLPDTGIPEPPAPPPRFGRGASAEPLAGKIGVVCRMMGVSQSTVRRRMADDPDFPRPFRLRTCLSRPIVWERGPASG